MKITAVCGFGVGSSVIAKMNIDSIMADEKRQDVEVDTVDVGSVNGTDADLYVTTHELFDNFPEELKDKTIVLDNFIDKDAIKENLDKVMTKDSDQK